MWQLARTCQPTPRPPPARPPRRARVEAACREIGGQLVEAGQEARSSSLGSHRFSFSFLAVSAALGPACMHASACGVSKPHSPRCAALRCHPREPMQPMAHNLSSLPARPSRAAQLEQRLGRLPRPVQLRQHVGLPLPAQRSLPPTAPEQLSNDSPQLTAPA